MDKGSAKDILRSHKEQLLDTLPLERENFLAQLDKRKLLPSGCGASIRAKSTRNDKVSYFLENIVSSAPHVYLPTLIEIMEQCDDLAVNALARDMKGTGTYYVHKILLIIYGSRKVWQGKSLANILI